MTHLLSRPLITIVAIVCMTILGCRKKPAEAAAKHVSGIISANTSWIHTDGSTEDYIIDGTVYVDAGLTIAPGTVIHFQANAAFEIRNSGYLDAVGTTDKKIVFEGVGAGFQGLVFYSIHAQNRLQFCVLKGGGLGSIVYQPAMVMIGENVTANGSVSIRDCFFDHVNGNGIYMVDGSSLNDFHNNSFTNNTGFPLSITAENIDKVYSDNIFSGNGRNYLEIRDCFTPKGVSQTWRKQPVPYYVNSQLNILGAHTVEAGATIVLGSEGIIHPAVSGTLTGSFTAIGTSTDNIIFKGENGTPGEWNSIFFSTLSGKNELRYCHFSFGGGPKNLYGQSGMIALDENSGGAVSIRDCFIDNSGSFGINLGGNTTFNPDIATSNTFVSNASGNIKY